MAQFNWTYLGDEGKNYNVGLFHGNNTGHVLIYCNMRVVLVDFHVLESKNYAFFLGEELCEIQITSEGDNIYSYDFTIDDTVDTPLNRKRKKVNRKHLLQSLAFFGTMAFFILVFTSWISNYQKNKDLSLQESIFAAYAKQGIAEVQVTEDKDGQPSYHYLFRANGRNYTSKEQPKHQLPKHTLPVMAGDEFIVKYLRSKPSVNQIDYLQPTQKQIVKYRERALAKHSKLHPEITAAQADCMLNVAFEIKGLEGIADIYFQDFTDDENPYNNQTSYKRLIRSIPFQQKYDHRCW